MFANRETRLQPTPRNSSRIFQGTLNSMILTSHGDKIHGNKDGDKANGSKRFGKDDGSKRIKMANGSNTAEMPIDSRGVEKENGIKNTERTGDRKKQGGRAVSLKYKPQLPDDERRCEKSAGKWRCAKMALEDLRYCEKHYLHKLQELKWKYARTGVDTLAKSKSGEPQLPVFTESLMSQSMSQVSHPDQHENIQRDIVNTNEQVSQGEPKCFTQFSELASLQDVRRIARSRFVPRRSQEGTDVPKKDTASAGSEKENTINLDSPCPLWSQISSPSSQLFSTEVLPANLKKNPEIDKTNGNFLVNAAVGTPPKQSSSSFHNVHGPPRFSQLLTQISQSKPGLLKTTQTRDSSVGKRKSEVAYLAKTSEAASTDHDDNRETPLRKMHLREQILASLLEPDLEDFVGEVEKVWDEIQESVSDNLESQVLDRLDRLEQATGFLPLSQAPSNWPS